MHVYCNIAVCLFRLVMASIETTFMKITCCFQNFFSFLKACAFSCFCNCVSLSCFGESRAVNWEQLGETRKADEFCNRCPANLFDMPCSNRYNIFIDISIFKNAHQYFADINIFTISVDILSIFKKMSTFYLYFKKCQYIDNQY